MTNPFQQIYAQNAWGHGSGEGSLPIHTQGYVAFLQDFLARRRIRSVVDMGCGDWQFSRFVDWTGIDYHGFDVVPSVISANVAAFQRAGRQFHLYGGDAKDLPAADLLITKDVLQHLDDATVLDFLRSLSKYEYALLTNCVDPAGPTRHVNIQTGGFRYLDLRLPPFNLGAELVYEFSRCDLPGEVPSVQPAWHKQVLLVQGMGPRSVN